MSQAGIINVSGQSGVVDSVTGSGNVTASPTTGNVIIGLTSITQYDVLVGGATNTISNIGPGSSGQVLQSGGNAANPAYSTATYPSTTTANQLLYSSSTNTVAGLTNGTTGQVLTATTGSAPSWQSGGGGGGITTIDGDSGSVTGSTIYLHAKTGSANAGASVSFAAASATEMILDLSNGTNTFLGYTAGNTSVSGSSNTSLGVGALNGVTSGSNNVAIGTDAMTSSVSGNYNIAIGHGSNGNITTQSRNISVGESCQQYSTGGSNIGMGTSTLQNCSGSNNVAIGDSSMASSSGSYANNTAVGYQSLKVISSGTFNSCFGSNTAGSIGSGSFNSCFGSNTAGSIGSGSYNTLIGQNAGSSYASADSSNICVGNVGSSGESNVMRIGTAGSGNGQVSTCYIAGISGVTVTGTAVLCSVSGQLGTIASSERYKENIKNLDENVSIMNLRPVEFNYKTDDSKTKMYGLIAEEVHKEFPYLCFYKDDAPESVKYHELPILLLKEIQKLNKRIEDLEASQIKKKK